MAPERLKFALQPRQVEAFRAVVQTGSMTAAADYLFVTQPAISRLIRDFELTVGFKLFQRQGTNLIPTSEALFLIEEVERCFVGLDKLAKAAADIRNLRTGRLNIAATPALSTRYLAKILGQLHARHADISFTVQSYQSLIICEMVARHQVDLGVGVSPRDYPGIVWEDLANLEAVCAIPLSHPLAAKDCIEYEDIKDERIIVRTGSGSSQLRGRIDSLLAVIGKPSRPLIECSLTSTMCALAAEGVGLALVDPFTANDFNASEIKCLPFRPALPYTCSIAYPAHKPRPQIAEEFARLLADAVARDFPKPSGEAAAKPRPRRKRS